MGEDPGPSFDAKEVIGRQDVQVHALIDVIQTLKEEVGRELDQCRFRRGDDYAYPVVAHAVTFLSQFMNQLRQKLLQGGRIVTGQDSDKKASTDYQFFVHQPVLSKFGQGELHISKNLFRTAAAKILADKIPNSGKIPYISYSENLCHVPWPFVRVVL